ncbi:trihelix transcription factor ASR3-like [Miscanthus floridulus]|uniref:trihelix transcription factor ASR3-like n=1 Tax=Miscanthus floridulus TaxID=154761 RepID=UPI003457A288
MDDTMGGTRDLLGQARDDEQARNVMVGAGALTVERDYRRGNWTLPETMLLIEAKRKVHEERHPGDQGLARWRWVEDYCWRAGCRRSQNQCNDRWDNLMRDYKKVRAYELSGAGAGAGGRAPSYWAMGREERKERGLPSNLLREIYDAMGDVIERRMSMGCGGSSGGPGAAFTAASSSSLLDVPMQASPLAQVLPRPLQPLEQETHGHSSPESPERKRRRPSLDELRPGSSTPSAPGTHGHRQEQGRHREEEEEEEEDDDDESSEAEYSDDDYNVLSGAIGRCAAILSEALESREAAEERRHREVMAVEERRGRARQARREAGEQCVAGLAAAVNQLAGSMLALAAAKHKDKGGGPAAPK